MGDDDTAGMVAEIGFYAEAAFEGAAQRRLAVPLIRRFPMTPMGEDADQQADLASRTRDK
jgi:hypothetical protein